MKLIIAGSRTITDEWVVRQALYHNGITPSMVTEIVSGTAIGVDRIGEQIAESHAILVTRFPADWDRFGKSAGYRRNVGMADYSDALLAVWDGKSKGTKHMIDIARKKGLKVYIFNINGR